MAYRGKGENLAASLQSPLEAVADFSILLEPVVVAAPFPFIGVSANTTTETTLITELATLSDHSSPSDDVSDRLSAAQNALAKRDFAEVAQLLDLAFLSPEAPLNVQIEWADALARANHNEQSDTLFIALLANHPTSRRLRFVYARRIHMRGLLGRAVELVRGANPFPEGSSQRAHVDRLCRAHDQFEAGEGRKIASDEDCRLLAMKYAILAFRDRPLQALPPGRLGRLSLVTGGLGPGGAERQLSRTASELEMARQRNGGVGGIAIDRRVEVLVRSHSAQQQRDFFLGDLKTADVDVREIDKMAVATTKDLGIADPDLVALIDYLPIKANFGVRRLVAHFRETKPEVVSLWQDGACLFGALAALMAGVPRVQLMIRGLPPVIRRHMLIPEYEVLYRAMAQVPGVEFISNSKGAALAYAQWLDIPLEQFKIVYNGVPKMECGSTPELDAKWQAFVEATPDGDHVVGGVFRFDTDKRPTWWIRFAYHYVRKHPKARFVLVGDGRLFNECVQMARDLKIADRILFVGRSTDVGYWMKKMDVLVLMSSYEGLPNVLIEAQYLGVPVVSTPAGGASECFIEGVTGHILSSADRTDFEEACEKVHALRAVAQRPDVFEAATRDFLEPNFSIPRMLENFMHATCGSR